eukprot:4124731-Pyramimonas_sp.AAC.1
MSRRLWCASPAAVWATTQMTWIPTLAGPASASSGPRSSMQRGSAITNTIHCRSSSAKSAARQRRGG